VLNINIFKNKRVRTTYKFRANIYKGSHLNFDPYHQLIIFKVLLIAIFIHELKIHKLFHTMLTRAV
jgi:hypothetical protein